MAIQSMHHFWELTIQLRSVLCVCVCVSGGHQEHGSVLGADDAAARGARCLRCHTAAQRQVCVCVCVYTNIHTHIHTHTHQSCFCMRERIALLTRSITKSVSIGVCFKPFCDIFNVSLGLFRPLLTYSRCCLTHVCVRQGHPQPSVITSVCGLKLLVHVLTQVSVREAHAQAFAHDVC
jgi:hypothetical protein